MQTVTKVNNKKSIIMTLRVPDELMKNFELLSANTNRSRNFLGVDALSEYVKMNAWQVAELRKTIEDADEKGEFISHEKVGQWLEHRIETGKWMEMPKPDVFLKK